MITRRISTAILSILFSLLLPIYLFPAKPATAALPFVDHFEHPAGADPAWTTIKGAFIIKQGSFIPGDAGGNLAVVTEVDGFARGTISANITLRAVPRPNASLVFSYLDADRFRFVSFTPTRVIVRQRGDFGGETEGVKATAPISLLLRTRVRVQVALGADGSVRIAVNGNEVLSHTFAEMNAPGMVGLFVQGTAAAVNNYSVRPASSAFARSYGGAGWETATAVVAADDGGAMIVGSAESFLPDGSPNIWAARVDVTGALLWQKSLGGMFQDQAQGAAATGDGGLIVTGTTRSFGVNGDANVWLIRLDGDGKVVWQRAFSAYESTSAVDVVSAGDGGFLVLANQVFTCSRLVLLKVDADGNMVWQKSYGRPVDGSSCWDYGTSLAALPGGGFIVAGSSFIAAGNNSAGDTDILVLKVDAGGGILWKKIYSGPNPGQDGAGCVEPAADGGFFLGGFTSSFNAQPTNPQTDAWVMRAGPDGTILWQRAFGPGEADDWVKALVPLPDGGVLVGTQSMADLVELPGEPPNSHDEDFWMLEFSAAGEILWSRAYGGLAHDYLGAAAITPEGDPLLLGITGSFGAGDGDLWLLRTSPQGEVPGFGMPVATTARDTAASVREPVIEIADAGLSSADSTADPVDTDALVYIQGEPGSIPPWVITDGARSAGGDKAVLAGSVNPSGSATTAWFEWGTDPGMTDYQATSPQSVGKETRPRPLSAEIGGLLSGTHYYWRMAASNFWGVERAKTVSFTSPLPDPEAPPWARSYGLAAMGEGITMEIGYSVEPLPDGGTLVAGIAGGSWNTDSRGWLLRLDAAGEIVWEKSLDIFFPILRRLPGGGFMVAGTVTSPDKDNDCALVRVTADGSILWSKRYGTVLQEGAESLDVTPDGGAVVIGFQGNNLLVFRVDAGGGLIWKRLYGEPLATYADSIRTMPDGGFVVAGRRVGVDYNLDMWIMRLNDNGEILWQKEIGAAPENPSDAYLYDDYGIDVQPLADGGYLLLGHTESFSADHDMDIWAVRIAADRTVKWQYRYDGGPEEFVEAVREMPNGDFVIAGARGSQSFVANDRYDAFVLRLADDGSPLGYSTFGAAMAEGFYDIRPLPGGDIAAVGFTRSFGVGCEDLLVVRLGPDAVLPPPGSAVSVYWKATTETLRHADALSRPADLSANGWEPTVRNTHAVVRQIAP